MLPFTRIVVGMDFNEPALAALQYARSIAKAFGSSVSVVHVIPAVANEVYAYSTQMVETWERSAYEHLCKLLPEDERAVLRGQFEVRIGAPVEEILDFAGEQKADLIVLGTHGRGPMGHLFLGSVAERVVRRAKCPVLTVGRTAAGAAKAVATATAVSVG
jgi:nucleotide-binding universal stress UspA family protein